MTEEPTGEAFELGQALTVIGRRAQPGDPAPEFLLDYFDGDQMQAVGLSDSDARVPLSAASAAQ